jgi:hypothetical protein
VAFLTILRYCLRAALVIDAPASAVIIKTAASDEEKDGCASAGTANGCSVMVFVLESAIFYAF